MSFLDKTSVAAGLLATGAQTIPIPINDIRVKIYEQLPWRDPTGMLSIDTVTFEPEGNRIKLTIAGELDTGRSLRVKVVPLPIAVGFELSATATLRFDPDTEQLFCQAGDLEILSISPLRGLGPLEAPIKKLIGTVISGSFGAIGAGVRGVGRVASKIPTPKTPSRLKGLGSRVVPGFVKRASSRVGGAVSSAAGKVSDTTVGSTAAAVAWMKSIIADGVNMFLSRTPIYRVPEEMNGIPLRGAVADIRVDGGELVVEINVTNNATLNKWRNYAIAGGVVVVGILTGIWIF